MKEHNNKTLYLNHADYQHLEAVSPSSHWVISAGSPPVRTQLSLLAAAVRVRNTDKYSQLLIICL